MRKAAALLKPVLPHWLMGLSAIGMSAFLMSLEPLFSRTLIDEALPKKDGRLFLALLAFMGAVALVSFAFEAVGQYFVSHCRDRIRNSLQAGILLKSWRRRKSASVSEVMQLTSVDAQEAAELLAATPAVAFGALVQFVWTAAVLFALNRWIAVAATAAGLTLFFLSRELNGRIARAHSEAISAGTAVIDRVAELFSLRALIRRHDLGGKSLGRLGAEQGRALEAGARLFAWETAFRVKEVSWNLVFCLGVAGLTGFAVFRGAMTIGEYIVIQIYVSRLQGPIRALLSAEKDAYKRYQQLRRASAAARLRDSRARAPHAREAALELGGGLVRPGSRILLAGSAEEPYGTLLESIAARFPRRQAHLLSPEPVCLAGTVRENILFGAPKRDEAAVLEAADRAGIQARELDEPMRPDLSPRAQLARALLVSPAILLAGDAYVTCLHEALEHFEGTVILAGSSGAMLELADEVSWVEGGRIGPRESLERFLAGPNAPRLLHQGQLQAAIYAREAVIRAGAWAVRNGQPLSCYEIELFGDARESARATQELIDELRAGLRASDLVFVSGRTRVRCVFVGAAPPERRIASLVWRHLEKRQARGVWFDVRCA